MAGLGRLGPMAVEPVRSCHFNVERLLIHCGTCSIECCIDGWEEGSDYHWNLCGVPIWSNVLRAFVTTENNRTQVVFQPKNVQTIKIAGRSCVVQLCRGVVPIKPFEETYPNVE